MAIPSALSTLDLVEEQQERRDEIRRREEAVIAREKASKKARKKRRRGTLELEHRPRVLPPEDPRPDYTLIQVEEHVGEVDSSEGPTITDLPEFKALALNDKPPKLELNDRSNECAYDIASSEPNSAIIEDEKTKDKSDYDVYETVREIKEYLKERTYGDLMEGFIALANGFSDPAQHRLDAQAFWASEDEAGFSDFLESLASQIENPAQCKASTKEIIENGKEWMGEEVMLAFEKYIEEDDKFEDVEYGLDELQHQCFSVENYHENFHHYNFTVKTKKKNSDDDWSSTLYFAQVREIYGRKFYYCYPLDPYDDGYCHACKNQGMDALRHPICLLGVETGNVNTGSPFVYLTDDDSDFEL